MIMTNKPKKSASDLAHSVVKASLGAMTMGMGAELFNMVITPAVERRRDEWVESIEQGLKILESKMEGFNLDDLSNNDVFISTILQATQAAIRNHQKEKLDAFRNIVLNSAIPMDHENDIQIIILSIMDDMAPWHLRLLKQFDEGFCFMPNTRQRVELVPGQLTLAITKEFIELKDNIDFTVVLINDLVSKSLIETYNINRLDSLSDGTYDCHVTSQYSQSLVIHAKHLGNYGQENIQGSVTKSTKLGMMSYITSPV